MSRSSRLAKNTLLVFLGNAGSKLISFAMLPFYTRSLSVEAYGTTDIIFVYATFLLGLVTCSITDSIFIFPKNQPVQNQKEYFSSGVAFSVAALTVTAFLFYITVKIAAYYKISNTFIDNIWLIYGVLAATFLQQYIQQFTRSIDKMNVYSITGIILTGATALFSFIFIPLYGVKGYVLAIVSANLVATLYSFIFSSSYKYFALAAVNREKSKEMLKYSIPLIPNGVMWWLVGSLNRPFLEEYAGLQALGLFAIANKLPSILNMVFGIFQQAWGISVLDEFNKEGYGIFYNNILKGVFFIQIAGAFLLTVLCKFIIEFLTTPDFYESWKYIPVLTIGVVFSNISAFVGSNFSATRESKYFFYSSIWGGLSSVVYNILLVPEWGLWGACFAVVLSHLTSMLSRIYYSNKYVTVTDLQFYGANLLIVIFLIINVLLSKNYQLNLLVSFALLALLFWVNNAYIDYFKNMVLKTKRR